jgi:hypothetical protein
MGWPFSRSRTVRCPDGTTRTIYNSIDEACPLFIEGWKVDVAASLKAPGTASGDANAKYENRINGLLFDLNEQNQSLMIHFRAVYLFYSSNPCGNDAFFQRKVENLIDQQHRISTLKLKIAALIQLVASNPSDSASISAILGDIALRIDGTTVADAASIEIANTRDLAKSLLTEPGQ